MINKYILPDFILRKITILKHKNKISLGSNCKIDSKSFFEGKNVIYNNVTILNSYIGLCTYVANNSIIKRTKIGRFSAIGENLRTYMGIHPTEKYISIHPSFYSTSKQSGFSFTKTQKFDEHKYIDLEKKYVCEIGNDVWIGNNVSIIDGVKIADGTIIASGSIVTRDTEPYSIIAGIPAKTIKFRFDKKQIASLTKLKWWNWSFDKIKSNADLFIDVDNLNELI